MISSSFSLKADSGTKAAELSLCLASSNTLHRVPAKRMKKAKKGQAKQQFPTISKKSNLLVTELRGQEIFQVEGVLTAAESERFIDTAESSGFTATSSRGPAFGEAYRNNSRISFNSPELADALWRNGSLQEVFREFTLDGKSASGLNPNIRFYKYVKGDKFGKHVDDSVKVGSRESRYTLLIYLSGSQPLKRGASGEPGRIPGNLKGGETLFYGGKRGRLVAAIVPEPGLALLHMHGDDCLEHEGAEVLSGVKYVLRSDILY